MRDESLASQSNRAIAEAAKVDHKTVAATRASAEQINVALRTIERDTSIQCRAAIDVGVVNDYAERMTSGDQFPPVVLFADGARYYIGDGWHRVLAADQIGALDISATVAPGGRAVALKHALPDAAPVRKAPRLNAAATIALRALADAIADSGARLPETSAIPPGKRGVTLDQWRERYHTIRTIEATEPAEARREAGARRKAFQRARDDLLAANLAATVNDFWWLA